MPLRSFCNDVFLAWDLFSSSLTSARRFDSAFSASFYEKSSNFQSVCIQAPLKNIINNDKNSMNKRFQVAYTHAHVYTWAPAPQGTTAGKPKITLEMHCQVFFLSVTWRPAKVASVRPDQTSGKCSSGYNDINTSGYRGPGGMP